MTSIGDKPVYATSGSYTDEHPEIIVPINQGIPYRLWLIGQALANPNVVVSEEYFNSGIFDSIAFGQHDYHTWNAIRAIKQADTIIKQLDSEEATHG
jgi:hypothetical protein